MITESSMFSSLDIHFANFIGRLSGNNSLEIRIAAALVSSKRREGHVCLDLSAYKGMQFIYRNKKIFVCPKPEDWAEKLIKSSVIGKPGDYKPLIIDRFRLYLLRYWEYQEKLAQLIRKRISDKPEVDMPKLKDGLQRLFPTNGKDTDWQKVAAFTALTKRFCVISGGPGTGKTATVAKILALMIEQKKSEEKSLKCLAAPTGKAAARLQESISAAISAGLSGCSDEVLNAMPDSASTIHRLLGTIPNSPYFRYNAENKLDVDVMVIDEASMADMALMSKLVQALPEKSHLILLGDRDQLASVEAGAVLGDICDTGGIDSFSKQFRLNYKKVTDSDIIIFPEITIEPGISDCIVQLKKSYRFDENSGIGALSNAVNAGDKNNAEKILKKESEVCWKQLPKPDELARKIKASIIEGYQNYLKALNNPAEAFQAFEQFRVLCALRKGPFGVNALNIMIERILTEAHLINASDFRRFWYKGKPVLITANDYQLKLFNGDVGITLYDKTSGELWVFFVNSDGSTRKLHPMRLPAHDTAYALTVHQSQGSEFDNVLLILTDTDSPVLTRELIYTGITRAKKRVEIWGNKEIFHKGISRSIHRMSGLRDELWSVNIV